MAKRSKLSTRHSGSQAVVPDLSNLRGLAGIPHWLGTGKSPQLRTDFDLINAAAIGISKTSIEKLTENLGITRKIMAEDILNLSVKTLERKGPQEKMDKKTSSHALEIARVMQHAYEVFGDETKMRRWFNTENKALNNMRPLQLFDMLTGLNMVSDVLVRIEEGVYS